jgi:hypothetical protein
MLTNLHPEQREIKTKKYIILVVLRIKLPPTNPIPRVKKSLSLKIKINYNHLLTNYLKLLSIY